MNNIWEIIIIALSGIGAVAFIAWYFFFASKKTGCRSCTSCRDDILKSIRDMNSYGEDKGKR